MRLLARAKTQCGRITVMEGWRSGPTVNSERWSPAQAGETALQLLAQAEVPRPVHGAR